MVQLFRTSPGFAIMYISLTQGHAHGFKCRAPKVGDWNWHLKIDGNKPKLKPGRGFKPQIAPGEVRYLLHTLAAPWSCWWPRLQLGVKWHPQETVAMKGHAQGSYRWVSKMVQSHCTANLKRTGACSVPFKVKSKRGKQALVMWKLLEQKVFTWLTILLKNLPDFSGALFFSLTWLRCHWPGVAWIALPLQTEMLPGMIQRGLKFRCRISYTRLAGSKWRPGCTPWTLLCNTPPQDISTQATWGSMALPWHRAHFKNISRLPSPISKVFVYHNKTTLFGEAPSEAERSEKNQRSTATKIGKSPKSRSET